MRSNGTCTTTSPLEHLFKTGPLGKIPSAELLFEVRFLSELWSTSSFSSSKICPRSILDEDGQTALAEEVREKTSFLAENAHTNPLRAWRLEIHGEYSKQA